MTAMKAQQILTPTKLRDLNKPLGDFFATKSPEKRSLRAIKSACPAIANEYPSSFRETIGGKVVGSGVDHWAGHLYHCMNYRRNVLVRKQQIQGGASSSSSTNDDDPSTVQPSRKRRHRRVLSEEDVDDPDADPDYSSSRFDEYGCVTWNKYTLP